MFFAFLLALAMPLIVPTDLVETEIEAPGPNGSLKGLMLGPPTAAGAPVVLIIPGSGPTDRDGNSPHGLHTDMYKLLAQGLAAQGIASVRIDKRGMYSSAAAIPNGDDVTIADYADDVHRWAMTIRQQTGAKCIWVLGHSEGGLVAMVASKDNPPDICGLLLVATAGRRLGDVMRGQLRANAANAPILDEALHDIDALEAGKRVEEVSDLLLPLFRPAVQGFLINLFSYDPPKLLATQTGPVLILQGERDIQISVDDARLLKGAAATAKLMLLPNVNHILETVASDDRTENLRTYFDPRLPLAPGVVDAIADFIKSP